MKIHYSKNNMPMVDSKQHSSDVGEIVKHAANSSQASTINQ
jgi:hypothetical protein